MTKAAQEKRDELAEMYYSDSGFKSGFDAGYEYAMKDVQLLMDALEAIAPSWLPENPRNKRREALAAFRGET